MKLIQSKLDHAEVLRRLSYNPETGELRRRSMDRRGGNFGVDVRVAGNDKGNGYRQIGIMGEKHNAHRLIWFMHHREWPTKDIDHINGIRDDNRIANLRCVSRQLNLQNRHSTCNGAEIPFLGVSKKGTRFFSQIRANGQHKYLGTYDTPEQAHQAYVTAKRALHEGCTI